MFSECGPQLTGLGPHYRMELKNESLLSDRRVTRSEVLNVGLRLY